MSSGYPHVASEAFKFGTILTEEDNKEEEEEEEEEEEGE